MKLGPCLCNPIHTGPISFLFHYFIRAPVIASLPLKLPGTLSTDGFPGSWSKRSNRSAAPQFGRLAPFLSLSLRSCPLSVNGSHLCNCWSLICHTTQLNARSLREQYDRCVKQQKKSFIFQVVFLENLNIYNLNLYLYVSFCLSTYLLTYLQREIY